MESNSVLHDRRRLYKRCYLAVLKGSLSRYVLSLGMDSRKDYLAFLSDTRLHRGRRPDRDLPEEMRRLRSEERRVGKEC